MTSPITRAAVSTAMPPLAAAHLIIGIGWLVAGVALGIQMAGAEDFTLRPVHAHANLVGWVTNALFGCFYWLRGGAARRREWLGLLAFNVGGAAMLAGLAAKLLDREAPPVLLPVGTLLVSAGILQMAVAIVGASRAAPRAVLHG